MKTFEKKSFPRMAKDFQKMNEKGTLSFDNAVQRNFVWKNTTRDNKMSMLIDTMLRGLPIPPMYCVQTLDENGNKCYDFIDGKQRTTTIIKFLNDEFELIGIPTFEDSEGNEIDLNGKKYSELSEDFQDTFKTYSLTVYYYEDMDDDSVADMFARLNNGKSMSAIELTRVKSKSFNVIKELASHKVFTEALSESALNSYTNEDIVIKSYIMLFEERKSLDTKDVRPIMQNAEISDEQKVILNNVFDTILELHDIVGSDTSDVKLSKKVSKRIYTRTHFISIVPVIREAIENEVDLLLLANCLKEFFSGGKGASKVEEYNSMCSSGSGHEVAVKTRIKAIKKFFDEYLENSKTEIIENTECELEEVEELEEIIEVQEVVEDVKDEVIEEIQGEE